MNQPIRRINRFKNYRCSVIFLVFGVVVVFNFVLGPLPCYDAIFPLAPTCPAALSLATETARDFSPIRKLAARQDGESPEEARVRLGLDEREAAWRAAGGLGCQVAAAGGLLGGVTADAGGCVVGHLVGGGQVYRAEEDTGERALGEATKFFFFFAV